jgi:hypothetical protein
MACAEMADHVKMFELFTRLESLAANINDDQLSPCIEDAVRLWTKMQVFFRPDSFFLP